MGKPLVSVVIPVYNASAYLRRCLDSVVSQTLRDIEIICVDDGSTDESYDILKEYQKLDGRVILLHQCNQYAGVARNNGMGIARGKYMIFWDADDYFREDALELLYCRAEETAADVVICDADGWNAELHHKMLLHGYINRAYLPEKDVFSWEDIPDYIFGITNAVLWNKLLRLEFVKTKIIAFSGLRGTEDVPFICLCLVKAKRISIVDQKLIRYSMYVESSLESTKSLSWESTFKALDILYQELCKSGHIKQLRRSFDNLAVRLVTRSILWINDYKVFYDYFIKFQTETIPKYGLDNHGKSYYLEAVWYERVEKAKTSSPEEYMLSELLFFRKKSERFLSNYLTFKEHFEKADRSFQKADRSCRKKSWVLPGGSLPNGSKVLLYGAGDVGQDFYRQIQREKSCRLVAWVDQKVGSCQEAGLPVEGTDIIKDRQYDYILIAVVEKITADGIRKNLLRQGIPNEKIIWINLMDEP